MRADGACTLTSFNLCNKYKISRSCYADAPLPQLFERLCCCCSSPASELTAEASSTTELRRAVANAPRSAFLLRQLNAHAATTHPWPRYLSSHCRATDRASKGGCSRRPLLRGEGTDYAAPTVTDNQQNNSGEIRRDL